MEAALEQVRSFPTFPICSIAVNPEDAQIRFNEVPCNIFATVRQPGFWLSAYPTVQSFIYLCRWHKRETEILIGQSLA